MAIRRRVLTGLGVAALALLAMAPQTREALGQLIGRAVQTAAFSQSAQAEVQLESMNVYALQLGAYDSGERAKSEMNRLQGEGILSVLWQREQMRLICDVQRSKPALAADVAQGLDAWVISDTLDAVTLRVTTDTAGVGDVRRLLMTPDTVFAALCDGTEPLSAIVESVSPLARSAADAYPDNALYTQLAQSLVNWCTLMESVRGVHGDEAAAAYARATMCTLCYELRQALRAVAQSEASMASAQRTPSTAAEVMPPA